MLLMSISERPCSFITLFNRMEWSNILFLNQRQFNLILADLRFTVSPAPFWCTIGELTGPPLWYLEGRRERTHAWRFCLSEIRDERTSLAKVTK